MRPLVSVIMPAYNSEEHIKKAIDSILNQTYSHLELIIINDGSKDKTEKIIRNSQKKDRRVRYYKNSNSGVSVARNIGLNNAKGEFISFVDSDDYVERDMIKKLIDIAIKYTSDLVSCSLRKIYSDKTIIAKANIRSGHYDKNDIDNILYPYLFGNEELKNILPLSIVTKIYRRDLIEKHSIRFESEMKFGEDLFFTQLYLLHSNTFYFLKDEILYNYIQNYSSATKKYQKNKWENLKLGISFRKKVIQKFAHYNFNTQLDYAMVNSSLIANSNIMVNKISNTQEKLAELYEIVNDDMLQISLVNVNVSKFSSKKKIIAILMRKKHVRLIYLINVLYYRTIR